MRKKASQGGDLDPTKETIGVLSKMNHIIWLICLFAISITPGCSQKLPVTETGYGLVAIPFKVSNYTRFQLVSLFELRSSLDDSFSFEIHQTGSADDIVISKMIAEGEYLVDTVVVKANPQHMVISKSLRQEVKLKTPIPLKIQGGEIVFVPILMKAEQHLVDQTIIPKFESEALRPEAIQNYVTAIKNKENSSNWIVRVLEAPFPFDEEIVMDKSDRQRLSTILEKSVSETSTEWVNENSGYAFLVIPKRAYAKSSLKPICRDAIIRFEKRGVNEEGRHSFCRNNLGQWVAE